MVKMSDDSIETPASDGGGGGGSGEPVATILDDSCTAGQSCPGISSDLRAGAGDSDSGGSLSLSASPAPPGNMTSTDDWNGNEPSDGADSGVGANGSTPIDGDPAISFDTSPGGTAYLLSPNFPQPGMYQMPQPMHVPCPVVATSPASSPIMHGPGSQSPLMHSPVLSHPPASGSPHETCSTGPTASGPGVVPAPSPGGTPQQYVVNVHVNAGETFSVRVGDRVQLIHGPATVRMVSNSGPPVPMPMQVPPGHMVQQIVDENGILTHVILSPQPPGIPAPPTMMSAPNCAPMYAPYGGQQYAPCPPQYAPHPHHPMTPRHIHPMMTPHMYHGGPPAPPQPPPHHHQCNSHAHHPPHVHVPGPTAASVAQPAPQHVNHVPAMAPPQADERTMRTRARLRNKLSRRTTNDGVGSTVQQAPAAHPQRTSSTGDSRDGSTAVLDKSRSNSVEDGQETEDELKIIHDLLSKIEPPMVSEIEARSALIQLSAPEFDPVEVDVESSEFVYDLSLSEKQDGNYTVMYSGDATEITLRDLKPATEYFVKICCLLDNIHGEPADAVSFTTLAAEPEPPAEPKLTQKSKTHLQLKWTVPVDNGSKVTSFILEYDQGSGDGLFVEVYNGPNKQHKVSRLVPSTSYMFRLAAVNAIGKSRYSEPVVYCTSGTVPPQPDAPTLSECCVKALTLTWVRRPCDDTFTLQMDDDATGHGFLTVYNGSDLSYKISQLRRNTEYKFRLQATNDEGNSQYSNAVCFRTLPDRPQPPPKPLVKGRTTTNSFRVFWDEPKDTGGVDIKEYQVQLDAGNGYQMAHKTSDREFIAERLEPGHTYRVRVCCFSSGGQSEWSEVLIVTTLPVPPGVCKAPRLHGRPKATMLTIVWDDPEYDGGAQVTDYVVNMSGDTSREVYHGHDLQCAVAGLLPGRLYRFQVRASNKAGWGPWSEYLEAVTGAGVPDAPKAPEIYCKSPTVAMISWEEPQCNGSPITEYHLEWQLKDEQEFMLLFAGPLVLYEVTKLIPATAYAFRVRAVNGAGIGPFSAVNWCQTPMSSPSAVTSVRASPTATTIHLAWKEPVSNGSRILSYNIDVGDQRPLITVEGGVLEYTILDVVPETAYKIRVQGVNAVGVGAFSVPIKVTTRALPPNPPSPLECVAISSNYVKLKWGDGKNPDLIRYTLEMRRDTASSFQAVYQGTSHMHKVNKLNECTDYQFRIFASNDAGDGPTSEIYEYRTTKAPPAAPKAPKVTNLSMTSCTVEWGVVKTSSQESYIYILQLQRMSTRDQDFHEIYRGSGRQFHIDNLTPKSDYQVRVCAVRHLTDESGASQTLASPFSATTNFMTPGAARPVTEVAPVSASSPRSSVSNNRLSEQQWAVLFLLTFAGVAVLLAFFAKQIVD